MIQISKIAPDKQLPSKWQLVSLQSLVDLDRRITYGIVKPGQFNDKGRFLVRAQDYSNGWCNPDRLFRVSDNIEIAYKRARLRTGDLLFTIVGSIGNTAVVPDWLDGANISQQTARIAINSSVADSLFCYYWLNSNAARLETYKYTKGGVQPALNLSDLAQFLVLLPSLAEQRKIAAILGTWDAAIAKAEQLVAALKARKRALMQGLLTGEVREGWPVSKLGDVTEILLSNVDKKSYEGEQIVRLCNYMDVFYNNYINNSMQFMEATANQREISKFGLNLHDVILTKDSETVPDIAQVAVVSEDLNNVICGYHLAILRPDVKKAFGPFLRDMLMVPDIHRQFEDSANGVTRFGLTLAAIAGITLPLPPIPIQKKVASILECCDKQVEYLQQYIEKLRHQKRALMQRLLTGEVRV